jgi:hypothetical protein
MQFIVFMIPAVYQPKDGKQQPGPDFKPDARMMAEMGRFNDELKKAGALLSVNGLEPLAAGARVAFAGGKPTVTDGPAINTPNVVGGYWLVEAKSRQQVIDWWKKCPAQEGDVIEVREIAGSMEQGAGKTERGPAVAEPMAGKGTGSRPPRSVTKPPHSTTRAPQGSQPAMEPDSDKSRGPWRKTKGARTKEQD